MAPSTILKVIPGCPQPSELGAHVSVRLDTTNQMRVTKATTVPVAVVVRPVGRQRSALVSAPFLDLSPSQFRLCWLLIELSHLANAAFALIAAAAHLLLAVPRIYENLSVLWVRRDMLLLAGWSYVLIGVFHVAVFGYDLLRSCRFRALTFGYKPRVRQITRATKTAPSGRSIFKSHRIHKLMTKLKNIWLDYFSIDGIFGARGARFEELFHIRQLIEVTMQTYQAYQLSRAIPRAWVIHGVVLIMLINCISAVVIEAMLQKATVQRRITLLVVDLLVDLAIAVVVPVLIILPRILAFDFTTSRFPLELLFSDAWATTAVTEVRQILVTSEMDYISSLLPHVLWLSGLDTIEALLRRKSSRIHSITSADQPTPNEPNSLRSRKAMAGRTWRKITVSGYLNVFFIIGMLAIHTAATVRYHSEALSDVSGVCALRVPAWMTAKLPCAVVKVNCHRLHSTGSDEIVSNELARFDRRSVARLIFSHCPALGIPAIVADFSHLRAFMVFNSTITSWSSTAALTNARQPMIGLIHFTHTNFSTLSFPDGIYHSYLPTGTNLLVFQSNLSTLPDSIDEVWASHRWVSFWIEKSKLSRLPPTFSRLNIQKLTLLGNDLEQLDDDLFDTQRPSWIRLSRNPLSRLPSSLEKTSVLDGLTHLLVEDTNITTVSETLHLGLSAKHNVAKLFIASFRGSPLCDLPENEDLCVVVDPIYQDDYRIDLVAPQRPL